MNPAWRLEPWNNRDFTAFDVLIDGEDITLVKGTGGMALRFPYETKTYGSFVDPGNQNAYLISIEGWLGHESDDQQLTIRIPNQIVMPNGHGLLVPITAMQLEELDAKRGSEPQRLKILLAGTARIPVAGERDASAANQYGVLTRAEYDGEVQAVRSSGNAPVTLTISHEKWLSLLSEAGPRQYRLIELPLPASKKLGGVVRLLEDAVVLLRRGETVDAIAKARKVVEGVLVETAANWDPANGLLFGRLLASAWSWTSEEHHYAISAVSKRAEAEFAIGLASDLLLLAGELVEIRPERIAKADAEISQA